MFASHLPDKGLVSKVHNVFLQLNNKINQRTQFKNEQKNWVDISPKETYK